MLLNQILRVSRILGLTWFTTRAGPPMALALQQQQRAEIRSSPETWRTLMSWSLFPLPSGYRALDIADRRTALLATAEVAQPDALIRRGLPLRLGRVSPARTVSSNSARSPS